MALIKHKFKLADGTQKESANWYYRFSYRGKTYFGSTDTANKTLAAKVEAKKKQELVGKIELGVSNSISVKQALQNYLDANKRNEQLESITTHFNKYLGRKRDVKVNAIEERWISVFGFEENRNFESIEMADMQQLVIARRNEGCSNSTILNELTTFSQTIKLNQKLNHPVPVIDFKALKKDNQIKPKKSKLRFLTQDEEKALLRELDPATVVNGIGSKPAEQLKAERQDIYDLTVFLLDTGARYGELAAIKWKDIDLKKRTLRLYRTKTKNETQLQMTSRVHTMLTRRLEDREHGQEYVFTAEDGGPRKYSPKAFNNAVRRAGIEGITLHKCRKTFASRLAQNGASIQEIQQLLGHSSILTTQIYAHLIPNAAASKAVSILENINKGE